MLTPKLIQEITKQSFFLFLKNGKKKIGVKSYVVLLLTQEL